MRISDWSSDVCSSDLLDLAVRPRAEQHPVSGFDVELVQFAVLVANARSDAYHLALHRLFLCIVGNDDAAGRLGVPLERADQDTVLQGTQFHDGLLDLNFRAFWHSRVRSAKAAYRKWCAAVRNTMRKLGLRRIVADTAGNAAAVGRAPAPPPVYRRVAASHDATSRKRSR